MPFEDTDAERAGTSACDCRGWVVHRVPAQTGEFFFACDESWFAHLDVQRSSIVMPSMSRQRMLGTRGLRPSTPARSLNVHCCALCDCGWTAFPCISASRTQRSIYPSCRGEWSRPTARAWLPLRHGNGDLRAALKVKFKGVHALPAAPEFRLYTRLDRWRCPGHTAVTGRRMYRRRLSRRSWKPGLLMPSIRGATSR